MAHIDLNTLRRELVDLQYLFAVDSSPVSECAAIRIEYILRHLDADAAQVPPRANTAMEPKVAESKETTDPLCARFKCNPQSMAGFLERLRAFGEQDLSYAQLVRAAMDSGVISNRRHFNKCGDVIAHCEETGVIRYALRHPDGVGQSMYRFNQLEAEQIFPADAGTHC